MKKDILEVLVLGVGLTFAVGCSSLYREVKPEFEIRKTVITTKTQNSYSVKIIPRWYNVRDNRPATIEERRRYHLQPLDKIDYFRSLVKNFPL